MSSVRLEQQTERALIRTIAGASRKLDEDLNLSPLQAIDRLQKLGEKFKEQWFSPSPFLVLEDNYACPVTMSVANMLKAVEKHGRPIGMVGAAFLKHSKRYAVLTMMFCKDEKSRKTVESLARIVERSAEHAITQVVVQMMENKSN